MVPTMARQTVTRVRLIVRRVVMLAGSAVEQLGFNIDLAPTITAPSDFYQLNNPAAVANA